MAEIEKNMACNRQPFLSEDGCDRGNVDIHQFDDFPFCEPCNPTVPEIPPEVGDTPVVLPVPTPCACVNITHKFKFKYSDKFNAKTNFAARGDCCEGEYSADFDLQIPCPINSETSTKKLNIKIGYGNNCRSYTKSYASANKSNCTITPKDVSFNIDLPCPLPDDADSGTLTVKIGYGDKGASAKQSFVKTNPDSCIISPKNMDFDLKIPCPIPNNDSKKIKAKISWNKDKQQDSQPFVKNNKNSCTIEPKDVTLDLGLPCPIKNPKGRKIKVAISYGDKFKSASASFIKANSLSCEIEPLSPQLNLNIPCPIKKNDKKLTIGIGWKKTVNASSKQTKQIISADSKNCIIEALEQSFDLSLPCPVNSNRENKISAKINWKDGKQEDSKVFTKTNKSDCTIEPQDVTLDLGLPCPIKNSNDKKIKAKISWKKDKQEDSQVFVKANKESCNIDPQDVTLDLGLPCPVKKGGKLKVRTILGDSKRSTEASILEIDSERCTVRVKDETLDLDIPCPIKGTNNPKIKAKIGYGKDTGEKSAEFLEQDKSNCSIKGKDVSLDLQIKCPVIGNGGEKKIKASVKYGTGESQTSATLIKTNVSNCTVEVPDDISLDLQIPCPVKSSSQNSRLKIKAKMGGKSTTASASILDLDASECSISVKEATFELNLPCPVTDTKKPKIKAKVNYGNSTVGKSAEFLEQDKSNCSIKGKDVSLDLQIKCPVVGDSGKKKIKASIKYGEGGSSVEASYLDISKESCTVKGLDPALNLTVPCPVSKSRLVIDTSYETIESGTGGFSVAEDSFDETCSRRIKLKVRVPSAGKVDATVLGGIRYKDHKLQVTTVNLKTGEISDWQTVFEAVAHTGSC